MTPEQKAAYIHAQSVAAQAQIEAMKALNYDWESLDKGQAYDMDDFMEVITSYGLNHNALIEFFKED